MLSNHLDVRHKEAFELFMKEFFELFFPDWVPKMDFSTAQLKNEELRVLFSKKPFKKVRSTPKAKSEEDPDDQRTERERRVDALVLLKIRIEGQWEQILIYWEQESKKKPHFPQWLFHAFCGIYFKYQLKILPIGFFTDPGKWQKDKEIPKEFKLDINGFPVVHFRFQHIKTKDHSFEEFQALLNKNPLAAAYLPLTDYPKALRPQIKAMAITAINNSSYDEVRKATLNSLVEHSLTLDEDEHKTYETILHNQPETEGVKMLQSIEEAYQEIWQLRGLKKGIKEGRKEGIRVGKKEGVIEGIKVGEIRGEIRLLKQLHQQGILPEEMLMARLPELEKKLLDLQKKGFPSPKKS